MEVLDRQNHRPLLGQSLDPGDVAAANRVRRGSRVDRGIGLRPEADPEEPSERRQYARRVVVEEGREPGARARADDDLGIRQLDVEPVPQNLDEGPGRESSVGEAVAFEPGQLVGEQRTELGQQAGLADARFADEQECLSATAFELGDGRPQVSDLARAADERPRRRVRVACARAGEREARTGSARPLTVMLPSGSKTKRCASRRAVSSPTAIVPGCAADSMRAATFVASPSATV